MNDFERKEYKNLLSDYIKASERILELEKENQELKEHNLALNQTNKEVQEAYFNMQNQRNKLKKIIKCNFFVFANEVEFIFNTPYMQEEIKEVLGE